MLRSIAALLSGFRDFGIALAIILCIRADNILRDAVPTAFDAAGRLDSVPILLLMLGYVAIFAASGCLEAGLRAPRRPMLHALVLGVLGLALHVACTMALWDSVPAWFHVASLALVMPCAWVGGRICEKGLERNGAGAAVASPVPA